MGSNTEDVFLSGVVFGFCVGTASISYAVRRGAQFLDVGVLVCPDEAVNLSQRREFRRRRRRLRSRKARRQCFDRELSALGLTPPIAPHPDPIGLRLRALRGEKLTPQELHGALMHLFKRRGYAEAPWANARTANQEQEAAEGEVRVAVEEMRRKLGSTHPCEYLAQNRLSAGPSPTVKWGRKIYWPREALEREFRAILQAQREHYPKVLARADWLLYGDTQEKRKNGRTYRVYFSARESRDPGILGVRWPRFDNRGPALDAFRPIDAQGRALHVLRKTKAAFLRAQWELAMMSFRVQDAATGRQVDPLLLFPQFVQKLRDEWNLKGKVSLPRLRKLAEPFAGQFLLCEGQKPLAPETGTGRSRYSSPTLDAIRSAVAEGGRLEPSELLLRRAGESAQQALHRYLVGVQHPLTRHRLLLFRQLLQRLVQRHGRPELAVIETVRSLALTRKAKRENELRIEKFRREYQQAREQLAEAGVPPSSYAIKRYRLWREAGERCPFCLAPIARSELGITAEIVHLVPPSLVPCEESCNRTVAHVKCGLELRGQKTPFQAFSGRPEWEAIKANAERCFFGRKREIFLSPTAETPLTLKAQQQHAGYLPRVFRHVACLELGWLDERGCDSTVPMGNGPSAGLQVTNSRLTRRLRQAWGLNQLLHPPPAGRRWSELSEAERERILEQNRGDLRSLGLDAMVVACTIPWLAQRAQTAADESGNPGWWSEVKSGRGTVSNPVFPAPEEMPLVCRKWMSQVVVRHHTSRSQHQQAYATTFYARKAANTYVAREVFSHLKPKDLPDIWPKELAAYCDAAWQRYSVEVSSLEAELKQTKGCIPESFIRRLCFSHFQQWRARGGGVLEWPAEVKIPIVSVGVVSVKDDAAVVPSSPGTHGFVKRTSFREVRIQPSADGKNLVPVFVPYWKGDIPVCDRPVMAGAKPIATIRRGMVVRTQKALCGHPPGDYRVVVTGQRQVKLLPHFVANDEKALLAFGFPKTGLQPYWADFIQALGYEPPAVAPEN